ncbi:MAGUK p55 subfamily member 4 [Engraulis encrasicolus]|uniref:MAGUK p55 subfamily member 4 n=1 Tax=Engraulis encrasicolus TaxID=184585 RepID=UPI002FD3BE63
MRPALEIKPPTSPVLGENGLTQILAIVVEEVRDTISKDINGADLLFTLLNAPWLQSLLKIYEQLQVYRHKSPRPVLPFATTLSLQVQTLLSPMVGPSPEARELYDLLRTPHMQSLLLAHDMVAQKDFDPVLPPLPEDIPEDEEAMRIVCLVKNNQPLGATIRRDEVTGEIFIARVIHGGLADRSGLLRAGDRLVEVNGHPVFGLEPEQIINILARSHGTIMFKVVPITERPTNRQTMLYVRAMVNYSPEQDPSIPCADAGMAFCKGDVLEIVDQTDALWWQAKKLPSTTLCAGLIPSTSLLKRKQKEFWWSQPFQGPPGLNLSPVDEEEDLMAIDERCVETDEEAFESEELKEDENEFSSDFEGVYLAGFRRSLRLCKRRKGQTHSYGQVCTSRCPSSCLRAQENPYEEVVRYQRQKDGQRRLIALIGPSGVGVNELRRKLIESDPKTYQGAVPHTTRSPKSFEEPGREYHFVTREVFENMAQNNRFVEFGEYRDYLYGTSIDAVKQVLDTGKICVIDIEPHGIQAVRTQDLKAYVIYIKPPPAGSMKESRRNSQIITNYFINRPFKEEEFWEMDEAGKKMESHFRQLFDQVIVNDDLQQSLAQLVAAVKTAEDEPQWVPASWIRPAEKS